MANKITYNNKVNLRNNPNIAEENKITDEDMNEIKEVVNTNANEQVKGGKYVSKKNNL